MNFDAYKQLARGILASEQGARLLRLDCMNPVKALAALRPALSTCVPLASIRDLELAWRARWGLTDTEGSVRMSTGVRPLLTQLFGVLAAAGRRLLAPQDVYPVYLDLAREARVALSTFPTVPHPVLPPIGGDRKGDALLLPEPLVPLGRGLNDLETAHIRRWLEQDRERVLILDCVYTFSERFTKAADAFLAGGRTVLLHSLAKGFLAPNVAGFAMGPPAMVDTLVDEIGGEGCGAGVQLLRDASDLPQRLGG
jgi:histidinol-phosphate/aromatic aminotransferase/cobyric acid decarboxylase-like protein